MFSDGEMEKDEMMFEILSFDCQTGKSI